MAPERHNSADPETVQDLLRTYEDPSDSTGFLAGVKRIIQVMVEGVRGRPGLLSILAFIAGVATVDRADARNAELEAMSPVPFSREVNDYVGLNDAYDPNLIKRVGAENPSLTWDRPERDFGDRIWRLGLRPMPGSTFEEMPPALEETPFDDQIMSVLTTSDGTEFRQSSLDGTIYRKRPDEPDFSPFLSGLRIDCMKAGRPGFLNIGILGRIYEMPADYAGPTPVRDPRGTIALAATYNQPGVYHECASEIPVIDCGIVLLDNRAGPMVYLERQADDSLRGPFPLPWANNGGSPTIYVNGTGIWIAFQNWDGTPPLKIYRAVLPHPDRDRDGIPNGADICPDKQDPHVQDGAACADTPEELAAFGFDRYVEPGILLAGAADVIPHPSPPPGRENPQQGVFRGEGGVRSTEAGHLIDMRAELPPPPPGFMWGDILVDIHVRDGEVILAGDPPQVFSPADGPQMPRVPAAGFFLGLEGTDVEAWLRGWTLVPIPDRDAGVDGDGGGVDAGVRDAAREGGGGDGGVPVDAGDARDAEAGRDGGGDGSGSDAISSDAAHDLPADVSGDIPPNIDVVDAHDNDENPDADDGIDHDPDANAEGDGQVAENDRDAGADVGHPHAPGGCAKCSTSPESPRSPFAIVFAVGTAVVTAFRRFSRKKERR